MAGTYKHTLFSNSAAGNSSDVELKGGKHALLAEAAAFGGNNIKVQIQTQNGTWIDVSGTQLTSNGYTTFDAVPGRYRAVSTVAAGMYAYLISLPTHVRG